MDFVSTLTHFGKCLLGDVHTMSDDDILELMDHQLKNKGRFEITMGYTENINETLSNLTAIVVLRIREADFALLGIPGVKSVDNPIRFAYSAYKDASEQLEKIEELLDNNEIPSTIVKHTKVLIDWITDRTVYGFNLLCRVGEQLVPVTRGFCGKVSEKEKNTIPPINHTESELCRFSAMALNTGYLKQMIHYLESVITKMDMIYASKGE